MCSRGGRTEEVYRWHCVRLTRTKNVENEQHDYTFIFCATDEEVREMLLMNIARRVISVKLLRLISVVASNLSVSDFGTD